MNEASGKTNGEFMGMVIAGIYRKINNSKFNLNKANPKT